MKVLILLLSSVAIVVAVVMLKSTPNDVPSSIQPLEYKPISNPAQSETTVKSDHKNFYFTDEKGGALFDGKKLILTPGKVEVHKDLVFQVVSDDNGRWKIELESKEFFIDDALNNFEEGALYPISDESLKISNPLILSKIQK